MADSDYNPDFVNEAIPRSLGIAVKHARAALRDYELGLAKEQAGRDDAIAAAVRYGSALNEGRELYSSDRLFGKWIADNKLDLVKPFDDRQERSAAQQIARMSTDGNSRHKLSGCPYTRPTDVMRWWRDKEVIKAAKESALTAPRQFRTCPASTENENVIRIVREEGGPAPELARAPVRIVDEERKSAPAATEPPLSGPAERPPPSSGSPAPQSADSDHVLREADRLEILALRTENARLKAENEALKVANATLEAEVSRLQAELRALRAAGPVSGGRRNGAWH